MKLFTNLVWGYLLKGAAALGVAALAGCLFLYVYKKYQIKTGMGKTLPKKKILLFFLFVVYLFLLIYATFFERSTAYGGYANFHPFRAWRDAWNQFSSQDWLNVLLNVAMFLPLGFCIPLLFRRAQKAYIPLFAGFVVSFLIEFFQLVTGKGLCDVDDLLCNTAGACFGGCLALSVLAFKRKRRKKAALYLLPPVLFSLFVAGTFWTYAHQTFGNLPAAPAYRVPVDQMDWIGYDPPDEEAGFAAVYCKRPVDQAACDRFAENFFGQFKETIEEKTYYQQSAVYKTKSAVLHITFADGSYFYQLKELPEESCADCTEEQVRNRFGQMGIFIPEGAAFSKDENGDALLTARMIEAEKGIYDGMLRCRLDQDDRVVELENFLIFRTTFSTVPIRSEAEAYEELQKGNFRGPDWFPGEEPKQYRITGSHIEYRTDTKGFYRPVYVFDALTEGAPIGGGLLVPAM